MVIKASLTAYNEIFYCPLLNDMRAVVSSCYLLMEFPTPQGVGQVWGDQWKAHTYYVASTKGKQSEETLPIAKQTVQD